MGKVRFPSIRRGREPKAKPLSSSNNCGNCRSSRNSLRLLRLPNGGVEIDLPRPMVVEQQESECRNEAD